MKYLIKFFITFIFILLSYAAIACQTVITMGQNDSWYIDLKGQKALFSVMTENSDQVIATMYQSGVQTVTSPYCYVDSPITVTFEDGNGSQLAVYMSQQDFNSKQKTVSLVFPDGFMRIH